MEVQHLDCLGRYPARIYMHIKLMAYKSGALSIVSDPFYVNGFILVTYYVCIAAWFQLTMSYDTNGSNLYFNKNLTSQNINVKF